MTDGSGRPAQPSPWGPRIALAVGVLLLVGILVPLGELGRAGLLDDPPRTWDAARSDEVIGEVSGVAEVRRVLPPESSSTLPWRLYAPVALLEPDLDVRQVAAALADIARRQRSDGTTVGFSGGGSRDSGFPAATVEVRSEPYSVPGLAVALVGMQRALSADGLESGAAEALGLGTRVELRTADPELSPADRRALVEAARRAFAGLPVRGVEVYLAPPGEDPLAAPAIDLARGGSR